MNTDKMIMKKKVGIITYHSAYNFGSFLQAYATQETIKKITGDCEIINYRTHEQKRVYGIFRWDKKHVLKSVIKNALMISKYKCYLERKEAYEKLFREKLALSEECPSPDDVEEIWNRYSIIVSGSDQIWNKHSNELEYVSWRFMDPYLLKGYSGKKISYASSPASMTDYELKRIISSLQEFDALSTREARTAEKLMQMMNVPVKTVLDPTFLLKRDEWISRMRLERDDNENYILFYVLGAFKELYSEKRILRKYVKKFGVKVKVLSPISFFSGGKNIEVISNASPVDFLNLILNARMVITDSYHGTILSVNFGKDFYSICRNRASDFRKTDILERLDIKDRIIHSVEEAFAISNAEIDYYKVNERLEVLRKDSMDFFIKALDQ